jgi:hypothetical protein
MSESIQEEWGAPRTYVCDDSRGVDAGTGDEVYQLSISQGGNDDWYVSVLPEGHRIGPTVRLRTSGGASTICPGLTVAIADAYRAMGGESTGIDTEAETLRSIMAGLCAPDRQDEIDALLADQAADREQIRDLTAEIERLKNPPADRGRLMNEAASAGAAYVDAGQRLARAFGNPKATFVQRGRANIDLVNADARKVAAEAALASAGDAAKTGVQVSSLTV